jgi:integrase
MTDFPTAKKNGKLYGVIYYRDNKNNKRRKFTEPTYRAWQAARDKVFADLHKEQESKSKKLLVDVAADALNDRRNDIGVDGGIRVETWENDERHIRLHITPHFQSLPISDITVASVNRFIKQMRRNGLSGKTQREVMHTLSMVCRYAMNEEYLQHNPCREGGREPIKGAAGERDGYTLEEVQKILAADMDVALHTLVMTAALTGLAANELQGLCWDCVDTKRGKLEVKRTGSRNGLRDETKTPFRNRVLGLPSALCVQLGVWKLKSANATFVFPSAKDRMGCQRAWSDALVKICEAAGVRFKGLGGFRKFYHTQMLLAGVDELTRKYRMGHSKRSNTAMAHYTVTDLSRAQAADDLDVLAAQL